MYQVVYCHHTICFKCSDVLYSLILPNTLFLPLELITVFGRDWLWLANKVNGMYIVWDSVLYACVGTDILYPARWGVGGSVTSKQCV